MTRLEICMRGERNAKMVLGKHGVLEHKVVAKYQANSIDIELAFDNYQHVVSGLSEHLLAFHFHLPENEMGIISDEQMVAIFTKQFLDQQNQFE